MRGFFFSLGLTLILLLSTATSAVQAQAWLSDRQRAEGHGIRIGDLELHPGIGSEVGYYSNVFNSETPQDSPALRVAPHLFLSTLTEERQSDGTSVDKTGFLAFRGGLAGTFHHYFTTPASETPTVGLDLSLDLVLNANKPVSVGFTESFTRTYRPIADLTPGTTKAPDFNRNTENAGVKLLFSSPGGLLKADVGYNFTYDFFDSAAYSLNESMSHSAQLGMSWEFLPKTALFYDASYSFQDYVNMDTGAGATGSNGFTTLSNNHRVNTQVGINGAITPRIGATASVGYSAGFYDIGDDYDGLTLTAEARWVPSDVSELALVFDRSFSTAFQGNFQESNRVYLRGRTLLSRTLFLGAKGGVEFINFGFDQEQNRAREDVRYFADISGEYRFISWFAVTAQAAVVVDDTDFVFMSTGLPDDPAKYTSFEAWLGLRAFF